MALIASARERPFGADELFMWTTDPAGRFVAADAVFARLTGYGREAMEGQTHAFVRHPAMPVALLPPRPGAMYVRYLAEDGASFWALVLTVAVGGGFTGVGFLPAGATFDAARERLQAVREAELDGQPFEVPDFRAAFVEEAGARPVERDAALTATARRLARLDEAFAGAERTRAFVEELAESIRLFALNAILAAHRLADSAAIGAVAGLLQTRSDAAVPDLLAFGDQIERVAVAHADARFAVASAQLLAAHPDAGEAAAVAREAVTATVAVLDTALEDLTAAVATIDSHFRTIRFLELQGRIEAARATDTGHVLTLFEEIGRQVRLAGAELAAFGTLRAGES
ncbi:PAS domain-containing protein [Solirubrobacter phytolaccae]|uniref:PAS domain-containing protein n=1 Tax=Solirubrobacter phytolaccae TaxID=1404360 RepID=A0A9X3NA23_9ACTN|nr:PAS domain-containing protein [Solirubrobacter phytolaccae]MDA0181209.1 PAS domain-containing protein [Solirubrobacter phytolaccae]